MAERRERHDGRGYKRTSTLEVENLDAVMRRGKMADCHEDTAMKKLLFTTALLGLLAGTANAGGQWVTMHDGELAHLPAHITHVWSDESPACKQAIDIGNLRRLEDEDDKSAADRLLADNIAHGECTLIDAGTQVITEQLDKHNSAICVRLKGMPFCVWTAIGVVTDWE
jgi:hypothetical protein